MLHTIIDYNDIFYNDINPKQNICRSSNPYDYIRLGYCIDNANLFGGKNNVSFNCCFSGNISDNMLDIAHK
ncbi:MAG: hypothetical protein ACI4IL_09435 [Eubacterium sp.]